MRAKWVEERLQGILDPNENILFESIGRIESKPPSGIRAMFYWMSYIFVNYLAIFVTARYVNAAYIILTNSRLIILSNKNWKFPLWSLNMSSEHHNYSINNNNISSFSLFESRAFWFITSRGILIESTGSLSMIINGINKEKYNESLNLIKNNQIK